MGVGGKGVLHCGILAFVCRRLGIGKRVALITPSDQLGPACLDVGALGSVPCVLLAKLRQRRLDLLDTRRGGGEVLGVARHGVGRLAQALKLALLWDGACLGVVFLQSHAGLALLLDKLRAHLVERLKVACAFARLVERGLVRLCLLVKTCGLPVKLQQALVELLHLQYLLVLAATFLDQACHLPGDVGDAAAVTHLDIELAAFVEGCLGGVEPGHVVGLVDKGVQAVAQAGRGAVERKAVLTHEDALLKRGAIQAEHPLAGLLALKVHLLAAGDIHHLEGVGLGRGAKRAHDAVLAPAKLKVERAAVARARPGPVAQALVFAHVARLLAVKTVQHGLDVGGDSGLAPAVGLQDDVEPLVEAQLKVVESAEAGDVAFDELHYSASSFALRAFQPQRTMRDFSTGLSESSDSTWRMNSAKRLTSVARASSSTSVEYSSLTSA